MKMPLRISPRWLGLACLAILAAATGPDTDPETLLNEGNAAFARGDYAEAADLYRRAEARTTDPGRVAFNRATAVYHQALEDPDDAAELLREAERLYRCCLELDDPRRPRALYGLGNCLLQRAGDQGLDDLKAAI